MSQKEIVVSPVFIHIAKAIALVLMIISSYFRDEAFFLIFFAASSVLEAVQHILSKSNEFVSESWDNLSVMTGLFFFLSLSLSYYLFFPRFATEVRLAYLIFVSVWTFNRLFSYFKFQKILILQHISLKITIISALVFTILSMLGGYPSSIIFLIFEIISFFSVIEEFLILRKMVSPDEEIESIFIKG